MDCNDTDASINPNATEIACDSIDQNCSGSDFAGTDNDSDGFRTDGGLCGAVDCDDDNSSINQNATEVCNYVDDDCDSTIDDGVTTIFSFIRKTSWLSITLDQMKIFCTLKENLCCRKHKIYRLPSYTRLDP